MKSLALFPLSLAFIACGGGEPDPTNRVLEGQAPDGTTKVYVIDSNGSFYAEPIAESNTSFTFAISIAVGPAAHVFVESDFGVQLVRFESALGQSYQSAIPNFLGIIDLGVLSPISDKLPMSTHQSSDLEPENNPLESIDSDDDGSSDYEDDDDDNDGIDDDDDSDSDGNGTEDDDEDLDSDNDGQPDEVDDDDDNDGINDEDDDDDGDSDGDGVDDEDDNDDDNDGVDDENEDTGDSEDTGDES